MAFRGSFLMVLALVATPTGALELTGVAPDQSLLIKNCFDYHRLRPELYAWIRFMKIGGPEVFETLGSLESRCRSGSRISNPVKINLSYLRPKEVLELQGACPANDGPNCFNLAMFLAGGMPNLKHSDSQTFEAYLALACQRLTNREDSLPGDLVVVRERRDRDHSKLIHGMVLAFDRVVFTKNGYSSKSPYQYQTIEGALQEYGVAPECRYPIMFQESNCVSWEERFRCSSNQLTGEPRDSPRSINSDFVCRLDRLEHFESILSRQAKHGVYTRNQSSCYSPSVISQRLKANPLYEGQPKTSFDRFIEGRARSVMKQLDLLKHRNVIKQREVQ